MFTSHIQRHQDGTGGEFLITARRNFSRFIILVVGKQVEMVREFNFTANETCLEFPHDSLSMTDCMHTSPLTFDWLSEIGSDMNDGKLRGFEFLM
jgi:hypothetical protein